MKKICSWCESDLGVIPADDSFLENAITHGICPDCIQVYFGPHPVGMIDFIDKLDIAVVVVDATGSVTCASRQARSLLQKELPEIEGYKGGEVFECAYATLPGGCGGTVHCDGCTIRNTVMDTFQTGKSHLKTPAYLIHGLPDENQEIQFWITTEKVKDIVLLNIEKV